VDRRPDRLSAIKRAVLFRLHTAPLVCRSHVSLLRALNPGVPIYGLYGGPRRLPGRVLRTLVGLDGLQSSSQQVGWNWQHSDLAAAAWFRTVGSTLSFDVLHVVEWDLLLLAPLESLYRSVPEGSVGLTALTPISELEQEWTWLRREPNRREWEDLLARARSEWGYDGVPYGCVAGGACLPRSFLEAYAELDPPVLCNDELRLPLFAQILAFPLADTRLRSAWGGERDHPLFHFRAADVPLDAIKAELAKPDGWRAFHPVRRKLDREMIFG
jgi:hypothetical protein